MIYRIEMKKFQFPSNGKVYSKLGQAIFTACGNFGFNSLQTGKCIARTGCLQTFWERISKFQFPSNGKVYSKQKGSQILLEGSRFNSLQTGKCIARDPILSPVGPWHRNPKKIHELRWVFFTSNFSPKIAQTRVYTDLYAIFHQKWL